MTADTNSDFPWRPFADALAERRQYAELATLLVKYGETLRASDPPAAAQAFWEAADTYERRFANRVEAAKCRAEATSLDGTIVYRQGEPSKVATNSTRTASLASSPVPRNRKRLRLIALHALAVAYALPTFFFAGEPPERHMVYRFSANAVVGLVAFGWNLVYWFGGFYGFIYRLSPKTQANTGARVRVGFRGIEWDRDVGLGAAVGLQLRLLGLIIVAFAIWTAFALAVVVIMIAMQDGATGVEKFLRLHTVAATRT